MIDKRYKDAIEALSTTYFDRLGSDARFNEQEFIQSMRKKVADERDLSPNMKGCIDKMVAKYVQGKVSGSTGKSSPGVPVKELEPIDRGRFQAYKVDGGWQIYIDGQKIGGTVDHKSAQAIIYWMEDCVTDLAQVLCAETQTAPDGGDPENLPPDGTEPPPF